MAKSTGIARQVDNLGRLVLPMELRRGLGINVKDPLDISVEGDRIVLRKHHGACVFCGSTRDTGSFEGKSICRGCFDNLRQSGDPSSVEAEP